jgi:hypothetical protein
MQLWLILGRFWREEKIPGVNFSWDYGFERLQKYQKDKGRLTIGTNAITEGTPPATAVIPLSLRLTWSHIQIHIEAA